MNEDVPPHPHSRHFGFLNSGGRLFQTDKTTPRPLLGWEFQGSKNSLLQLSAWICTQIRLVPFNVLRYPTCSVKSPKLSHFGTRLILLISDICLSSVRQSMGRTYVLIAVWSIKWANSSLSPSIISCLSTSNITSSVWIDEPRRRLSPSTTSLNGGDQKQSVGEKETSRFRSEQEKPTTQCSLDPF